MAHTPETRKSVRAAYVYQRLALEVAAASHGVSPSTAQRWRAEALRMGDDWDQARAASSLAGEGRELLARQVLEDYLRQHQAALAALDSAEAVPALARAEALSRLADSFNKIMAAHARLQPELSRLAVAMEVLQRLASFISEKYPQHAGAFLELLEPFGAELSRVYA